MNERLLEGLVSRRHALQGLPTPERARAIRMRAGATQAELAAVIGVRRETLLAYEKGHSRPTGRVAIAYAAALEKLAIPRAETMTIADSVEAAGDGHA
jgi:DNA-binding XRE family transcriptional regulator